MAEMTIGGSIMNTRNNGADSQGYALPPIAANLKDGQIAINTSDTDPCIFFKSTTGKIVKIPSEGVLVKALTDILGNSAADLDTLRELIAQFEGSANDILPMLTALTDRVTAAETSLTNKADKSSLNTTNTNLSNHTGNRNNPHAVTAAQVGALPSGGTAVNSDKLGNRNSEQFGWQENNWKEVDLNTLTDKTYFGKLYAAKNAPFDSHAFASFGAITHVMQFNGFEGQLKYRTINVDKISAWFSMWHSGNNLFENAANTNLNNLDKTKWSTVSIGNFTNLNNPSTYVQVFNFGGSSSNYGNVQLASYVGGSNNFYLRGYQDTNIYKNWVQLFHTDNANRSDTNWTCNHLNLTNSIRNAGDGTTTFDTHLFSFSAKNRHITIGSGTTESGKDVKKISIASSGAERITIIENGNVGVNNPNPTEKLDVSGKIRVNNGSDFYIDANANNVILASIKPINFEINSVIRGTVLANGNWGFGTTTPSERIDVNGNIKANGRLVANTVATLDGNNVFSVDSERRDNTTVLQLINASWAAGIASVSGALQVRVGGVADDKVTVQFNSNGADFKTGAQFNGNVISNGDIIAKKSGAVTFSASDAAAGATRLNDLVDVKLPTNLADKMVLAYDPAQVNSDGSKGGYTFMPSAGTGTGKIVASEVQSLPDHNHNDIGYVSASDERLKENIAPLTGALNIILHFKPKQYTWNAEGNRLGLNDPRAYGLIAQEAAELKDIVDIVRPMNTSEEYLGVDYVKIVPILVAGVQEQHKEIISLNQKLESIKNRANKAYGSETNNADKIAQLETDNASMRAEIEELKMLIKNR